MIKTLKNKHLRKLNKLSRKNNKMMDGLLFPEETKTTKRGDKITKTSKVDIYLNN